MARSLETIAVQGAQGHDEGTGAISFPIYQSATFRHPGLHETTGYDYSRLQNPTREELERTVALLEGGRRALAFSSGMAAIAALLKLFVPGDHLVVSDDLYGGTYRLFEEVYSRYGLSFSYVDASSPEKVAAAVGPRTKGIYVETPTNPLMKIADIRGLAGIAREHGVLLVVDNTLLTPYFQQCLNLGADVVVHSGTKFLGGHNDTLAGFLVANDPAAVERLELVQKSEGAVLAPMDAWLILRGLKTLGVRLRQQQENAMAIAAWLAAHPLVEQVYYPGLETHPGHDLCSRQASGFGALLSFTVRDSALVERILGRVRVVRYAESLGGVESLITYPVAQTHAAIPEEVRDRLGVTDKLLRLSVGIEAIEDLLEDLGQALGVVPY